METHNIAAADAAITPLFFVIFQSSTKSQQEENGLAHTTAANIAAAAAATATGAGGGASTLHGSRGSGGTVVALTGAARRRQMVAGDRAPLPPIHISHHTVRNPSPGGGTWTSTKPTTPGSPSSSPTRRERVKKTGAFSPMGRFRVGVVGVGATRVFLTSLSGAAGGARGAVVGGGGAAGSGPAVGSAQEKAMVLERKVSVISRQMLLLYCTICVADQRWCLRLTASLPGVEIAGSGGGGEAKIWDRLGMAGGPGPGAGVRRSGGGGPRGGRMLMIVHTVDICPLISHPNNGWRGRNDLPSFSRLRLRFHKEGGRATIPASIATTLALRRQINVCHVFIG